MPTELHTCSSSRRDPRLFLITLVLQVAVKATLPTCSSSFMRTSPGIPIELTYNQTGEVTLRCILRSTYTSPCQPWNVIMGVPVAGVITARARVLISRHSSGASNLSSHTRRPLDAICRVLSSCHLDRNTSSIHPLPGTRDAVYERMGPIYIIGDHGRTDTGVDVRQRNPLPPLCERETIQEDPCEQRSCHNLDRRKLT